MIKLIETHQEKGKEEWFLYNDHLYIRITDHERESIFWVSPNGWSEVSEHSEDKLEQKHTT